MGYSSRTTAYTVSYGGDQNWCTCKVGATGCNGGSCWNVGFDTGTASSCCGADCYKTKMSRPNEELRISEG